MWPWFSDRPARVYDSGQSKTFFRRRTFVRHQRMRTPETQTCHATNAAGWPDRADFSPVHYHVHVVAADLSSKSLLQNGASAVETRKEMQVGSCRYLGTQEGLLRAVDSPHVHSHEQAVCKQAESHRSRSQVASLGMASHAREARTIGRQSQAAKNAWSPASEHVLPKTNSCHDYQQTLAGQRLRFPGVGIGGSLVCPQIPSVLQTAINPRKHS